MIPIPPGLDGYFLRHQVRGFAAGAASGAVGARRTARTASLEKRLFAPTILGDDRAVHETFLAARPSKPAKPESVA